ncbi:MAG: response regulator [Magnetococcales bacterium]|nr:response regulator [Magnetococcales bacterium]
MKLSLPIKFAILSLFISLIGMIGISLFVFHSSDVLLQKQALARLGDDLEREKAVFSSKLNAVVRDLQNLAKSDAIEGIIRATRNEGYDERENMTLELWKERLARRFSTIMEQRLEYAKIRLIGNQPRGLEMVRVERFDDHIRTSSPKELQFKEKRPYFREAILLEPGEIYFSDITLNRERGNVTFPPQPMLRLAIPLEHYAGESFGVVIINVDFEIFSDTLLTPPEGIYYFLANRNGDYLLHPDKDKRLAFEFRRQARIEDDFPEYSQWLLGGESQREVFHEILSEKKLGVAITHFQFDPWRQKKDFLAMGAVAELSLIEEGSNILQTRLFIVILFGVLLVLFITLIIAKQLTQPIRALTKVADQVTAGNESIEIPLIGNDEITALGYSLKTMLERLSASRQELALLNRSLEDQVQLRTRELKAAKDDLEYKNSALIGALQQAEESARSKSEFLATMSHEIRTPMNGVLGMTEMLMTTPLSSRQQRYADVIYRSGESLLTIINDILDLSKIEAGKMELIEKPFDLREMIEGVLDAFFIESGKKQLDLALRFKPVDALSGVVGDISRLRQVLVNLVGNAVKFTDRGSITVHVIEQERTESNLGIRIEVVDTGIGIPAEIQQGLFEPFVQGDGSSSRSFGGTGLGLAIVKRLVSLLGGRLGVESSVGQGATFWFEITFKRDDSAISGNNFANLEVMSRGAMHNARVLVVDDNQINREIAREYLNLWGLACEEAEEAEEALKKLTKANNEQNRFGLVLMDHMMPGMTGVELSEKLSQDPRFSDIPIILLSSVADHEESLSNYSTNLRELLRKPVRKSVLYNSILTVLQGKKGTTKGDQAGVSIPDLVPEGGAGSFCNLLLVEDSDINAEVAIEMLQKLGYSADWVDNGEAALKRLAVQSYHLVLMDCHMPGLDGFETTQKIREQEQLEGEGRHIPIVALTAKAMEEDRLQCLAVGMDDYLAKPIRARRLQDMIDKWCRPENESEATTPSVDWGALKRYRREVGARSDQIISRFLKRLPKQCQIIEDALLAREYQEVQRAAHKLKGMARQFGGVLLGDLCQQMENQSRDGSSEGLDGILQRLKREGESFSKALKSVMGSKRDDG